MKVRHWNISKIEDSAYGMTKYEDELANGLRELGHSVEQIRRQKNALTGNTVASWLTKYRNGSADIVHATFQTVAPAALIHRPSPIVVTVHDLAPLCYPSEQSNISSRIQWLFTPLALRYADHIIAISDFTKQEIQRLLDISPDKISVIHQGIDHDIYKPLDQNACQRYFDLNPDKTYVLVVSSDKKHKRVNDATEILQQVNQELGDVKLLKAGYGTGLDEENVVTTGWIDEENMPKLYNAADVYLHTSEYEGFGLPILEALACGTPVVARSIASIPEIVGDIYNLADKNAGIAELAHHTVEHLRDSEGEADDTAVSQSEMFSWRRTAEETQDVYNKVAEL